MPPRLLIVEDDATWGRWMARAVSAVVDPTVVRSVQESEAVLHQPWAGVVIDRGLPDGCGLQLAMRIRAERRSMELLLFTGDEDPALVDEAARHGISCAHKTTGMAMIERFAETCAKLARADARTSARLAQLSLRHSLTRRDQELVSFALQGLTRAQIAEALQLSENTVRAYTTELLAKTGHDRMSQLVAQLTVDPTPENGR